MVCTKAFGMGIDIPDIPGGLPSRPSGHLRTTSKRLDVWQESLRFKGGQRSLLEQDKVFMRTLFGMSSLKPFELQGVLKKLYDTWKLKKSRHASLCRGLRSPF